MVGDGSYLMLVERARDLGELGLKLTVVLLDNRGYESIGSLSRSLGLDGFGTLYRYRREGRVAVDGDGSTDYLPVDLAANADSLGATVLRAATIEELRGALAAARGEVGPVVIVVEVDRYEDVPSYESWWDVPVAEVSGIASVRAAREKYEAARPAERSHL